MPREKRSPSKTGLYHIMKQGCLGTCIFETKKSRNHLLDILIESAAAYNVEIYGFRIVPDHVHLIVRADCLTVLSRFVCSWSSTYATWYNRVNGHAGNIYANRYHCRTLDSETALWECLRYLHMHPFGSPPPQTVPKNKVSRIATDSASSMREYLGMCRLVLTDRPLAYAQRSFSTRTDFLAFHQQKDLHLYLDTTQDTRLQQKKAVLLLLQELSRELGLPSVYRLLCTPALCRQLTDRILKIVPMPRTALQRLLLELKTELAPKSL